MDAVTAMTGESDRPRTTETGDAPERTEVGPALLGWLLYLAGALSVGIYYSLLLGSLAPWQIAWAVVLVACGGVAFRAGGWLQRRERKRRAARRAVRRRPPWSVVRCSAMLLAGGSLFAIGWLEILVVYNPLFPLGATSGWMVVVGAGTGMLLVGGWELHRRLHGRDLDAAMRRLGLFARLKILLWGLAGLVALAAVGLLIANAALFLSGSSLPRIARFPLALVAACILLVAAVRLFRSAWREACGHRTRPHHRVS